MTGFIHSPFFALVYRVISIHPSKSARRQHKRNPPQPKTKQWESSPSKLQVELSNGHVDQGDERNLSTSCRPFLANMNRVWTHFDSVITWSDSNKSPSKHFPGMLFSHLTFHRRPPFPEIHFQVVRFFPSTVYFRTWDLRLPWMACKWPHLLDLDA